MVLMFLSFALWWALENVMDAGWSALIVAIIWGIIGAVAFVMGRKKFQRGQPEARTDRGDPSAGPRRPQAQLTTDCKESQT